MKITTVKDIQIANPELYQAILEEGVQVERVRVLAHLDTARMYDSLQEATEAIRAGVAAIKQDGELVPYPMLHDRYAAIEDERDRLDLEAASGYR